METEQVLPLEQKIGLTNWNYCYYSTGPLKAMISQGVDCPSLLGENPSPLLYWVSVLKDERQEVFQEEFLQAGDAVKFITEKYGHWDFTDTTQEKGGCGSCSNS